VNTAAPINSASPYPGTAYCLLLSLLLFPQQARTEDPAVKLITEHSAFTQTSAKDDSGGEATDFVQRVLDNANISRDLIYLPWRRAYHQGATEPNTLIFPLARTAQREEKFLWVGQLIPVNYYLFKLKSRADIQVKNLDDARPYSIGVVNYHVHHEYLLEQDFTGLQPVNGNAQNLKKALLGRIDLFPISDGGLIPVCERENIDCSQFEPVLKMKGISGGLYMAYSTSTDPVTVQSTAASYQQLLEQGVHAEIFRTRLDYIEQFNARWPLKVQAE
jgi:polar amino acid transport system substrate-binding protein